MAKFLHEDEQPGLPLPSNSDVVGERAFLETICESARLERCSLTWDDVETTEPRRHLSEISLQIKRGSLVAVVGRVGSGKSSLLRALLGRSNANFLSSL